MARTGLVAVLIIAILATFASATVQSFCKCTCFQNSTIIALGPQHDNGGEPAAPPPPAKSSLSSLSSTLTTTTSSRHEPNPEPEELDNDTHQSQSPLPPHPLLTPREASTSCKQCNRAFCLKYNLPICKDAEDKDIKTTCFQRDSPKDRVIVWGFLLGTAGLLGWAALRRVVEAARLRRERERGRQGLGGGGMATGAGTGGVLGGGGRFGGLGGFLSGRGNSSGEPDRGAYSPLGNAHEGITRGPG